MTLFRVIVCCVLCARIFPFSVYALCRVGRVQTREFIFGGTIEMPRCPALVPVSESASGICVHVACMCLYMYVAQRLYG